MVPQAGVGVGVAQGLGPGGLGVNLDAMSVTDLRALITRAGLPVHNCFERTELRQRAQLVLTLAGAVSGAAAQVMRPAPAAAASVPAATPAPVASAPPAKGQGKAKEGPSSVAEGPRAAEEPRVIDETHFMAWTKKVLGPNGEKATAGMQKVRSATAVEQPRPCDDCVIAARVTMCDSCVCNSRACDSRVYDSPVCNSHVCDSRVSNRRVCNHRVCDSRVCDSRVCVVTGRRRRGVQVLREGVTAVTAVT